MWGRLLTCGGLLIRLLVRCATLATKAPLSDGRVEEVRKLREEHAARFNYDVDAIFDDLKKFEKERGLTVVSLEPNRILQ